LTDTGLPAEGEVLAAQLKQVEMPVIGILGNHDHESGEAQAVTEVLGAAGVKMLDASVFELDKVGFVGTKGFCGGFVQHLIQPFGEQALKTFIRTSIDEAVSLENALTRLSESERRMAILHYAPIIETLQGEPVMPAATLALVQQPG
jgi:Icc-related predicted phosphoesterase